MCGPSAAGMAAQRYEQIKPKAEPLPSLSVSKKMDRKKIAYGAYRTGQQRRTTMLNVGLSNG